MIRLFNAVDFSRGGYIFFEIKNATSALVNANVVIS